jgi:hypothetical protein
VHPFYQRKMRRVLQAHGVAIDAVELKGKEHWWWDTAAPNDGGAVFDGAVRAFLAAAPSQPAVVPVGACQTHTALNPSLHAPRGAALLVSADRRGCAHYSAGRAPASHDHHPVSGPGQHCDHECGPACDFWAAHDLGWVSLLHLFHV